MASFLPWASIIYSWIILVVNWKFFISNFVSLGMSSWLSCWCRRHLPGLRVISSFLWLDVSGFHGCSISHSPFFLHWLHQQKEKVCCYIFVLIYCSSNLIHKYRQTAIFQNLKSYYRIAEAKSIISSFHSGYLLIPYKLQFIHHWTILHLSLNSPCSDVHESPYWIALETPTISSNVYFGNANW